MGARVLSLADRLPPEAPVHREQTLYAAARIFLLIQLALELEPPSPSELIDQLSQTTNPSERQALADAIARTAP